MQHTLLEAKNITLRLNQKTVLDKVSLSLHPNQIVTIIGPNGAGKTSLVKVLLGLAHPVSGSITRQKNLKIGYMPQRLTIDRSLPITVEGFLQVATSNATLLTTVLTEVGIKSVRKQSIHHLSGGEFQRVLLARALLKEPELLVLDEPLQGVDLTGQTELYQLISAIRAKRGCGILLVSHDLHFVMATTDQVICLNHHVCCSGHPELVSQHPEFKALFGESAQQTLALYTHTHDHHHT